MQEEIEKSKKDISEQNASVEELKVDDQNEDFTKTLKSGNSLVIQIQKE